MPVATWSGHCAGTERADRNELRGMPASGGARREGQPRPVTTDRVISRHADMVVATAAAPPPRRLRKRHLARKRTVTYLPPRTPAVLIRSFRTEVDMAAIHPGAVAAAESGPVSLVPSVPMPEDLAGMDDEALLAIVRLSPRASERRAAACGLLISRHQ